MSAVVEAISDVVSDVVDFAGDVVETVVETASDVVETVGKTAEKVVQSAIDDPIGTIAKVVAVATGQVELLPLINAADVVAHGGDLGDALTAAAVSYVAPEVGNAIGAEVAGTAFGDMLNEAAAATGIESLPGAVTRGIGTAATSTVANIARGQDFGDALESGAISGVSSIVGRVVGSEADTGSNFADRLIGTAVGAATNASLRGGDVDLAIENAVARDIFNTGLGFTSNEIKTAIKDYKPEDKGIASLQEELPMEFPTTVTPRPQEVAESAIATETGVKAPTMLASADTGTISDVVQGVIPKTTEITKPISEEEAKTSDEMFNELVNQFSQTQDQVKVDALGNVYDKDGNFIGYASDFNMTMTADPTTGGVAWQTEEGQLVKPVSLTSEFVPPTPEITTTEEKTIKDYGIVGDQEGDYPTQIINNPDGSVTSVEANGTSYTFNVDGSITFTDYEGNQSTVGSQDPYEVDQQTSRDESNALQGTGTDSTLNSLVNSLLGSSGATSGPTDTSGLAMMGAIPFIAALGDSGGGYDQYGAVNPYQFNWNPYDVNAPVGGVAYGQQFFEPAYNQVSAAGGGLMSIPQSQPVQYIQPTVPNMINTNKVMLEQDPTASVQMYRGGGHLGSYSDGGRMLKGPGDGMSDDIPATIAGRQPARLANEEFVIPADVVSHLGNGSSEAGARVLYKMMADVRKARTGKTKQASQIKPERFMPRR